MDLIDINGDVIGTYDPNTGSYITAPGVDPAVAGDVAAQWWAVGYGAAATDIGMQVPFGQTKPDFINYAGYAPPVDPIAAGIDPSKIVKTQSGDLFKYIVQLLPNGTRSYTAVPYTPSAGLFGLSPTMLMLIGVVGFVALGDSGKSPKRRGR